MYFLKIYIDFSQKYKILVKVVRYFLEKIKIWNEGDCEGDINDLLFLKDKFLIKKEKVLKGKEIIIE